MPLLSPSRPRSALPASLFGLALLLGMRGAQADIGPPRDCPDGTRRVYLRGFHCVAEGHVLREKADGGLEEVPMASALPSASVAPSSEAGAASTAALDVPAPSASSAAPLVPPSASAAPASSLLAPEGAPSSSAPHPELSAAVVPPRRNGCAFVPGPEVSEVDGARLSKDPRRAPEAALLALASLAVGVVVGLRVRGAAKRPRETPRAPGADRSP